MLQIRTTKSDPIKRLELLTEVYCTFIRETASSACIILVAFVGWPSQT